MFFGEWFASILVTCESSSTAHVIHAPPHFLRNVRQHMQQNFREYWVESGGPVIWPARSPDQNSMVFFTVGTPKNLDVLRADQ
jgi:hypothetical protein